MLKSTVLDPQGQTIQRALSGLGYSRVQDVRQGKFLALGLDGLSRDEANSQVQRIAKDVLINSRLNMAKPLHAILRLIALAERAGL